MTDLQTNPQTNNKTNPLLDTIRDLVGDFFDLFSHQQKQLVTVLRQPTPLKITQSVQADATGTIGGGLTNPNPVLLWIVPMSHEAWVNRITITSPSGQPKAPLTTGQAVCSSGMGEIIFFLPLAGDIAPVQITEGRLSAAHLTAGSRINFSADSLPANTTLRIDFQIVLVSGISADTPRTQSGPDQGVLD